ncbi:MAG: GNAT family N-acetyltransferase [Acidobacteriaceae bacterium]|nr:GNAT family N-acetyltransferase [Acidobacteriaceae bacterium]
MAGFYRHRKLKERHKGTIWGVFVKPSHRGIGGGRSLISGILDRVRLLQGLRQVLISVTSTQDPARQLYISFGFRVFGVEPDALNINGRNIDEAHLVLGLITPAS